MTIHLESSIIANIEHADPNALEHYPESSQYALVTMTHILPESNEESTLKVESPEIAIQDKSVSTSSRGKLVVDVVLQEDSQRSSRKSTEDGSTELNLEVQTRQLEARERVSILRSRVSRSRQIKWKRKDEVRPLREETRDALDRLKRKLDELSALGNLPPEIEQEYQRFCAAQDALGPAENALDTIETRLDQEEVELEEEEEHFYRHNEAPHIPVLEDSKLEIRSSPLAESYNPSDSDVRELDLAAQSVRIYLEHREKAERLKEELYYLESEFFRIDRGAKFNKQRRIPLSKEATIFFSEYEKEHAEITKDLKNVEDAISDLKEKCVEENLFGESDYVYVEHDELAQELWESIDDARERSPLRVAAQNTDYFENETGSIFEDKKSYVNSWLLDWVQDSSVNVLTLKDWIFAIYPKIPSKDEDLEDDKWSGLALEFWNTDAMGADTDVNYNASRLDAIDGNSRMIGLLTSGPSHPSETPQSLHISHDSERSDEPIILGSESGSYTTQKEIPRTPKVQRSYSANDIMAYHITPPTPTEPMIISSSSSKTPEESNITFSHTNIPGQPTTIHRSMSSQDLKVISLQIPNRRK